MNLLLSLKRLHVTSNASRNVSKWSLRWYERRSPKKLSFRKKSSAGRSSTTGKILVYTKSALLSRVKLDRINYNFRILDPGFVSTLKLVPFSSKLLTLVTFSSGALSYFPAIAKVHLFSPVTFRSGKLTVPDWRGASYHSFIHLTHTFKKVSNLEVRPGAGIQYVRSAGSFAKIIKFDYSKHAALVRLPSGVRKFFSFYSTLLLGPCALKLKRKQVCTKSGFWRSFGLKPKVRGVARNPVDHPHGGRTKSIKYPRTPWGKTTKFK